MACSDYAPAKGKTSNGSLFEFVTVDYLFRIKISCNLQRRGSSETCGIISSKICFDRLDIPNSKPTSARTMMQDLQRLYLQRNSECHKALSKWSIPNAAWSCCCCDQYDRKCSKASWQLTFNKSIWYRDSRMVDILSHSTSNRYSLGLEGPCGLRGISSSRQRRDCPLERNCKHLVWNKKKFYSLPTAEWPGELEYARFGGPMSRNRI